MIAVIEAVNTPDHEGLEMLTGKNTHNDAEGPDDTAPKTADHTEQVRGLELINEVGFRKFICSQENGC
jgi:hypothetical protein